MRDKLNLHRRERDPQHRPMVEGGQFADDFFFFFQRSNDVRQPAEYLILVIDRLSKSLPSDPITAWRMVLYYYIL